MRQNPDGTETRQPTAPAKAASQSSASETGTGTSSTLAPGADPAGAAATPEARPAPPPPPNPAVLAAYIAQLPTMPFVRNSIALDPAHGGVDSGATIASGILEKDVDLAFEQRLRALLMARGFTVTATRDGDSATEPGNAAVPLSLDGRAGILNHAFASACLLLHATSAGQGVHLYASELDLAPAQTLPTPWLRVQAAWVTQSQQLAVALGNALNRSRTPLISSRASVRPLDSLSCPALVVELAPENGDPSSINGSAYQQRVAEAIAAALIFWQNHAQPPARSLSVAGASKAPGAPQAAATKHPLSRATATRPAPATAKPRDTTPEAPQP